MDNKKQEQYPITGQAHVERVNAYLKIFVVVILSSVISWKLLWIDINLVELKATDILSIVISLFAIGLSVAFYFKATDTSNDFYDNTYKFTKEVSEILGRIEAGFGERLKHLDEGYSSMSKKIDVLPYGLSKEQAEQKIEKEEEAIQANENERQKMIVELINKANMQEIEKNEFLTRLERKERELLMMRNRIGELSKQLESSNDFDKNVQKLTSFLRIIMRKEKILPITILNSTYSDLRGFLNNITMSIPDDFLHDMIHFGYYDPSVALLTRSGVNLLKKVAIREDERLERQERLTNQEQ